MPNVSIEELVSVLAGSIILFAGGFLSRAGQDVWSATKLMVKRKRAKSRRSMRGTR